MVLGRVPSARAHDLNINTVSMVAPGLLSLLFLYVKAAFAGIMIRTRPHTMPPFTLIALGHRVELLGRRLRGSVFLVGAFLQPTPSLPQVVQAISDLAQRLVQRIIAPFFGSATLGSVSVLGRETLSRQLNLFALAAGQQCAILKAARDPVGD